MTEADPSPTPTTAIEHTEQATLVASTSPTRPPNETPFFWWELNNEQKLKRTIATAPLAPVVVVVLDVARDRPINVLLLAASVVMGLAFIALYWMRVRDERDVARVRSVFEAPALPADARFGFLALAIAPVFAWPAIVFGRVSVDINTPATIFAAREAVTTAGAIGAPFALVTLVLAGIAIARRSTRASQWAALAAIGLLAAFVFSWGTRLNTTSNLTAAYDEMLRRGAAEMVEPDRWQHISAEQHRFATTSLWRSALHPQAVVAARTGLTFEGFNEAACQNAIANWAKALLAGSGAAISSPVDGRATTSGTRERCRISFRARDADGSETPRTVGAIACPTTGGSVLYLSTTLDPNDADDAARALRCNGEPL
jgi:hypothetical protein